VQAQISQEERTVGLRAVQSATQQVRKVSAVRLFRESLSKPNKSLLGAWLDKTPFDIGYSETGSAADQVTRIRQQFVEVLDADSARAIDQIRDQVREDKNRSAPSLSYTQEVEQEIEQEQEVQEQHEHQEEHEHEHEVENVGKEHAQNFAASIRRWRVDALAESGSDKFRPASEIRISKSVTSRSVSAQMPAVLHVSPDAMPRSDWAFRVGDCRPVVAIVEWHVASPPVPIPWDRRDDTVLLVVFAFLRALRPAWTWKEVQDLFASRQVPLADDEARALFDPQETQLRQVLGKAKHRGLFHFPPNKRWILVSLREAETLRALLHHRALPISIHTLSPELNLLDGNNEDRLGSFPAVLLGRVLHALNGGDVGRE
jgi:hypothetical protein